MHIYIGLVLGCEGKIKTGTATRRQLSPAVVYFWESCGCSRRHFTNFGTTHNSSTHRFVYAI